MMTDIVAGLASILTVPTLLLMIAGLGIGVLIGVLPGMSATLAIALFLPMTMYLEPLMAIPFLIGVYRGGLSGGAITSILVGVPGSPVNVVTMEDGRPLALAGYPRKALRLALYGSVAGAVISSLVLVTVADPVAQFALDLGSPELFTLLLFSMALVSLLSGSSLWRGLASAGLGMFVALIGVDSMSGSPRFTFGFSELVAGVPLIPLFVGLFAIPELARIVGLHRRIPQDDSLPVERFTRAADDDIGFILTIRRYWRAILTGSGVGSFIGVLPGIGSETSPWIAYGIRKRLSKRGDDFGKGEPEGVVASESANDAVAGAAFVPTLIFGVPGDLPLAVMLGALMAQGIMPGPRLFVEERELVFGIIAAVFMCSVLLFFILRPLQTVFSRIVNVPNWLLVPVIGGLAFAGAFGSGFDPFNFLVLAAGGILGYTMKLGNIPVAPFVLAFIIGPALERFFRESLMLDSSLTIFVRSPFAIVMLTLAALVVGGAVISQGRRRKLDAQMAAKLAD